MVPSWALKVHVHVGFRGNTFNGTTDGRSIATTMRDNGLPHHKISSAESVKQS